MITYSYIFIAQLSRSLGHHLYSFTAVAPSAVNVQIAADVAHIYQAGKLSCQCGLDFASTLPQFRDDEQQSESGVDTLLRPSSSPC